MADGSKNRFGQALAVLLAGLTCSAPSYAYLDPGTGSIILQSILAGIAVAMGMLRLYWHRLKAFIGSLTGSNSASEGEGEQDRAQDADSHNPS